MRIGVNGYFLGLPNTGIETVLRGYLEQWAETEHDLVIFCTKKPEQKLPENLRVVVVAEPKLPNSLAKYYWERKVLPKAIAKENCEVFWSPYPNVTRLKIPHLMTVHDIIPWVDRRYARWRTWFYYKCVAKNLAEVTKLHFVSESACVEFQKFFPKIKTSQIVVPNAINVPNSKDEFVGLQKPYLFYLGGYDPRKNVALLIKTWAKYVGPKLGVDLVLGGKPPRENRLAYSPEKLIRDLPEGLRELVHLTGALSETEKFSLYRHALGFVHLSESEGFNLPLLEAISVGCPALVSDLLVHREVGGGACLYIPLHEPEQLEDLFKKFVQEKDLRQKLKNKCKTQAALFSWKKSADRLLQALIKI